MRESGDESHFQILNPPLSKAFIGSTLGPTFPNHQDQDEGISLGQRMPPCPVRLTEESQNPHM